MQTTTAATKAQIQAINITLKKRGLFAQKPSIIAGVTDGRTEHSSELFFEEAKVLLTELNDFKTDPRSRMRNSIIAMAHDMQMIKKVTKVTKTGMVQANDYSHLDAWMLKFGYKKKCLFDYSYEELPTLVTQFKAVYADHLKK